MVSPVVESGIEAVAPVETAVRADAMQTSPLIRQSLRISSRLMANTANQRGVGGRAVLLLRLQTEGADIERHAAGTKEEPWRRVKEDGRAALLLRL